METRAGIARHPIHPMLIPFPIALWIFSLVSDLIYVFGFGGAIWKDMALYTMIGGIVGALAAAVPGYIDYRTVTDPSTVRIAKWHMIINFSLVLLFSADAWLRFFTSPQAITPVVLSFLGVGALGVSGWLGGELVYLRGVGVKEPHVSSKSPDVARRDCLRVRGGRRCMLKTVADLLMDRLIEWGSIRMVENAIREVV